MPGDTIEVSDIATIINGSVVSEPYAVVGTGTHPFANVAPRAIPDGEIFVMGDNRDLSLDSRVPQYGSVYTDHIVGRARFIIWSDKRERIGKKIE